MFRGRRTQVKQLQEVLEQQKGQLALALAVLLSLGFELSDFLDLTP